MVKYVGMIANGGHNLDVTLIKSIKMQMEAKFQKMRINGYVNEKLGITGNSGSDLQISDKNLQAVKEGMKGVTSDRGGTAYRYFGDFNIEVAGKNRFCINYNNRKS